MSRNASVISDNVSSRANGLDRYLIRIEGLRAKGQLSTTDAERAYTGGFLEFHAFVERSIERLFVGLLQGRLKSSDQRVRARVKVNSHAVAHDIIRGERLFVDWLPYDRYTVPRGKAFFSGGRPFDRLSKADVQILEENGIIRNALAHQSAASLRRFRNRLVGSKSLPPDQQRPAGYLRGFHTVGQTRMNYHLAQTVITIRKLSV